jgi:ferritin-like metal-binding protein YciE
MLPGRTTTEDPAMLGRMKMENLRDLYLQELRDVYDAEHQVLEVLPRMSDAAHDPELKSAFRDHIEKTRRHVQRLENVFNQEGEEPDRRTCHAMKGILREGEDLMKAKGDDATLDAALIAAAQRVEHYEIAVYGTLCAFARTMGKEDEARLLQEILDEESSTDRKLTEIAESRINVQASH